MKRLAIFLVVFTPALAAANPPVASYIFPAGGQRGTKVPVRVGGLFLHQSCGFEMLGQGVTTSARLKSVKTIWFEGPLLPLPDSQRQEDYPKDMAGEVAVAADAPLGLRYWRLSTSQGATPSMKFVVGELPEIVENEIDGEPVPVKVTLPVTINGRIFPHENIDVWTFQAVKGQTIRCEVHAARLGSPLDARLEVRDSQGRKIAENDDHHGPDPMIAFIAPADGEYQVRIQDTQNHGGQAYVYRLTLTSGPVIERVFPLGGKRGSTLDLSVSGQNVPGKLQMALPKDAPADFVHSFAVGKERSNVVLLDVDDLPEFLPASMKETVPLPAMLNGRIEQPGRVDQWQWTGKKGDSWEFELRAAQLGSRLDGVLAVLDAAGKTLARAEANPGDPLLRFQVPADGAYVVAVQDRFRSRGGPDFAYRLRVAPPPPADFRLFLASDAVTLPRKGTAKLKVDVQRRGGFKDRITLAVRGLPDGVSVANTVVAANQAFVELLFKADDKAKIDLSRLSIFGETKPLLKDGKLTWPVAFALGKVVDAAEQTELEKTFLKAVDTAQTGKADAGSVGSMNKQLEAIRTKLIKKVNDIPTADYLEAKTYLDDLTDARTALQKNAWVDRPLRKVQAAVPTARGLPELSSVLLAVALPAPFTIKGDYDMGFAARGGMHKRKYKIERNGYDGPIEVSLADRQARHLQGVEGETITVPAGATEFFYTVYMPPWMETGRTSRTCVMGVAKIKDEGGKEHEVSHSSVNTNEQMIAVVGPSKLGMIAERTSFTAQAGQSFTVPLRIQRGLGIDEPVELELIAPGHVQGLKAIKSTIAAKQDQGTLTVECARALSGPFNMPFIVRATLIHGGERVVAEVKIDVQP